jgi:hypothetical protein
VAPGGFKRHGVNSELDKQRRSASAEVWIGAHHLGLRYAGAVVGGIALGFHLRQALEQCGVPSLHPRDYIVARVGGVFASAAFSSSFRHDMRSVGVLVL